MILVIGGRSKIGSTLIDELVSKGEPVRALVRTGEKGTSFGDRVQAARGDLAEVDSLRTAVAGVDRVFLLCGPTSDEVRLNQHAIDVAKQAGVGLLVRSSILGADPDSRATFLSHHGTCDSYLEASGVPYTILRPNMFMQNVPESTVPSIDRDGNFYANAGNARISMVDTRDVAATAARVLTEPGHADRAYDLTGPEALSYHDVADKLAAALGRKISYIEAPDDAVRDALRSAGLGDWLAESLVELFQEYRRSGPTGYAAQVTGTVRSMTGRPARSLDQLLAD